MKQKHLLRTFSALALAMCISFSIAVPTGAASAGTAQGNTLAEVLERAAANGFCYRYDGDDQVFDGSRIVNGTAQDISRLKASVQGTLLIRYQSAAAANQVLFAAGKDTAVGHYGAVLANKVPAVNLQRIDFPDGMVANLSGTAVGQDWHTFVTALMLPTRR